MLTGLGILSKRNVHNKMLMFAYLAHLNFTFSKHLSEFNSCDVLIY